MRKRKVGEWIDGGDSLPPIRFQVYVPERRRPRLPRHVVTRCSKGRKCGDRPGSGSFMAWGNTSQLAEVIECDPTIAEFDSFPHVVDVRTEQGIVSLLPDLRVRHVDGSTAYVLLGNNVEESLGGDGTLQGVRAAMAAAGSPLIVCGTASLSLNERIEFANWLVEWSERAHWIPELAARIEELVDGAPFGSIGARELVDTIRAEGWADRLEGMRAMLPSTMWHSNRNQKFDTIVLANAFRLMVAGRIDVTEPGVPVTEKINSLPDMNYRKDVSRPPFSLEFSSGASHLRRRSLFGVFETGLHPRDRDEWIRVLPPIDDEVVVRGRAARRARAYTPEPMVTVMVKGGESHFLASIDRVGFQKDELEGAPVLAGAVRRLATTYPFGGEALLLASQARAVAGLVDVPRPLKRLADACAAAVAEYDARHDACESGAGYKL